ncbi:C-C chemokine receptor type 1-like [Apostichopus japonicus]|uniref:C-C chemokine receptor type 1-like n=1 Tax=Stichopus japonicus TaxID=307972 RepID=UPI003AB88A58
MSQPKTSTNAPAKVTADTGSWSYSYDFDNYCETTTYGKLAISNTVITVLGLLASFLLMMIICKNPRLRQDKYLYLNNLIGSCCCLLFVSGTLYIEDAINPCWQAGPFLCRLANFSKTYLTNTSTAFLILIAIQQLNRYRQKFVTVFNATHTRCLIVMGIVWAVALLVSIPEFVFASVLWYSSQFSICQLYLTHLRQRFFVTAKLLFVEYIAPLVLLSTVTTVTGIYVIVLKSRYSTWGTTTGESLVPRDKHHPRHFGLVFALTVVFLIGYFPIYSYELVISLARNSYQNHFATFWWHMESVSTFFVLLPPALTPILIMLLSWEHCNVLKSIYQHFTVPESFDEVPQDSANNGNDEKAPEQGTQAVA